MDAFDLALGFGGVGEDQRDVVELQPLADAGDAILHIALKGAGMIDIDFQREPVRLKCLPQKVQVGGDGLVTVEGAPHLQTAAIVDHVQQRERRPPGPEPGERRGVQLPELPHRPPLPPAQMRGKTRWLGRRKRSGPDCPVAHL